MAEKNDLREKIGATLITILLTALGAVAAQSAKYMFVDLKEKRNSLEQHVRAISSSTAELDRYVTNFHEVLIQINQHDSDQEKVFSEALKSLSQGRMNGDELRTLRTTLRTAYADLGTISYSPIVGASTNATLGTSMDAVRAAKIQDLKTRIRGLELLSNWAEGPGGLKEKGNLEKELERNLLASEQSLHAMLAVQRAAQLVSEQIKREGDDASKQLHDELEQLRYWGTVENTVLSGSLLAYGLLLYYTTIRPRGKTPEKTESKSSSSPGLPGSTEGVIS